MEIDKQVVEEVSSSQVVQTGDNSPVTIVNGMKPAEVIEVCETIVQKEIANYSLVAEQTARDRYRKLSAKLEEALEQLEEVKLEKIKEPAIQIAANETFTEYIRSGEEFLGDQLIDMLIERMSVPEHTAKQIIIDEARRILPKLTKDLVDFLAILTFLRLMLPRPRLRFVEMLRQVGDLGKNAYRINTIDIALLKQSGCATDMFLGHNQSLEQILLEIYDPFFRKAVPKEQILDLLRSFPEINKPKEELAWNTPLNTLLNTIGYLGDEWYYKYSRNDGIRAYDKAKRDAEMSRFLTEFDQMAVKMSVSEVKAYLLSINENWERISYLYSKDYVQSLFINPVGHYIGLRQLCKQLGEEISYFIFYPQHI